VLVQTCCPGYTATEFHALAGVEVPRSPGGCQTADEVVAESLAGLDRRREFVITGRRNRLLVSGLKMLPRRLVLWGAARSLKPS
jgi:short-subunit dehydrogenase